MARGDILLFRGDGSLAACAICHFTHGPFCHVAVDLGDGTDIGAHTNGIEVTTTPYDSRRIVRVGLAASSAQREVGISWLLSKRKDRYGWEDIFNQLLVLLHLGGVYLGVRDHYDCSDFVAHYVALTGGLPALNTDAPNLVTPNDIGRAAGLC